MDFNNLNKEQRAAVEYSGKHALVIAGAGTGKTRTIIARAIFLINNAIRPDRIKILSFTKKSANEIINRIRLESEGNALVNNLSGSTFHSWCMDIITSYPDAFGLKGFSTIDEDDRIQAFSLILGRIYGKKKIRIDDRCKVDPNNLVEIYSYEVNTRCSLSDAIKAKVDILDQTSIEKIKSIATEIIREYMTYKKEHRYIDYDDMLMVVAKAMHLNEGLRSFICGQYEHILVDEAQDTNPLQWYLLENFYDYSHLFLVGDDAQSIYGFRGADFKSIHTFIDRVKDSTLFQLSENYRSTQEILDLSNWLLEQSPLKYNKRLVAHRGLGEKPIMYHLRPEWETAEVITNTILQGRAKGKRWNDYLVLSRSAYKIRTLEAACLQRNIPYAFFGGTALMKSAHIRDIVSALRIIENFKDELAWTRFLTLFPGIGEVYAAKLIDSLISSIDLTSAISFLYGHEKCEIAHNVLSSLKNLKSKPGEAARVALEGLEQLLSKKYDNWELRKRDFDALFLVADKSNSISSFVTEYLLDPIADYGVIVSGSEIKDTVTISTIHSAKGLEADTCFILNVSGADWPTEKAKTFDEIEEERRCLYVALTRAKNKLYLMSTPSLQSIIGVSSSSIRTSINRKPNIIGKNFVSKEEESLTGKVLRIAYPSEVKNIGGTFSHHVSDDTLYAIQLSGGKIEIMSRKEIIEKFAIIEKQIDDSQRYFFNRLPSNLIIDKYIDNARRETNSSGYEYSENEIGSVDSNTILDDFNFD